MYMYACMYMYMYIYIMIGKNIRMFKLPFVCCTFESKFSFLNFAVTPTLMFAHLHSNMWLIMWACSSKVEAMFLAASVSFLSPMMLNPSRNSDRNKTSRLLLVIKQFWRHSIANQGKSNIW